MRYSASVLLGLALMSCSSTAADSARDVVEEVACEEKLPGPKTVTILVEDTQFNPTIPGLRERVSGCFRIECAESVPSAVPETYEQKKQSLIQSLTNAPSCHIVPNLRVKRRKARPTEGERDRWNAAIRAKRTPDGVLDSQEVPLRASDPRFESDHGSRVASILAASAPENVAIVLLQRKLRSQEVAPVCPSTKELEDAITLNRDPDVLNAVRQAPREANPLEYFDLLRRHRVALKNESFGTSLADQNTICPNLPWAEYFASEHEVEEVRRNGQNRKEAAKGLDVLIVQSAGNDSALLAMPSDGPNCEALITSAPPLGENSATLVVGSYNYEGAAILGRSAFSNFGPCVQTYGPGERIVSADTDGFLLPRNGTSFAAPLVAALIARNTGTIASGKQRKDEILLQANGRNQPLGNFPKALLFK
jgi:Subtilase family